MIEGISTRGSVQSFAFANINVCEHENEGNTPDVGLIKVTVDWRKFGAIVDAPDMSEANKLDKAQPLHEKAKKMTTHRVVLGEKSGSETLSRNFEYF